LSLREKKLAYYLSQAALAGRDIIYDQNYAHNLRIRKLLAAVVGTYSGDRGGEDFTKLVEYAKRVWFAHGIHHHYSNDKMLPEFTPEALVAMVAKSDASKLPLDEGQTRGELLDMLRPVMFDPDVAAKKVTLDPDVDQVVNSATNYYNGVTAAEVEQFYAAKVDADPERPVSWGLNSQLAKVDGEIVEHVWKIDGMYGPAIEQIVHWLEKAVTVAESDAQKAWIDGLVRYYRTGDLRDFDEYNIAWVADTDSRLDAVNGFIEVYGDPLEHPQAEDYWGNVNPVGPRGVYDEAKRFGEALTMAYHRHRGLDTGIARIFNTFGARMRPHDGRAIPTFLRQALQDKPLTVFGDGSQTRSFCYVADLIAGLVSLMESDVHLPVNIGNPEERTLLELAEAVIKVTDSRAEIVYEALPIDDPQVRQPDISRARELLGWDARVELEEGLRRTIEESGVERLVGAAD